MSLFPHKVAVLGATGVVGQRMVRMLENHPWFELAAVLASERSAGAAYGEAVDWRLPGPVPAAAAALPVLEAGAAVEAPLLLSALTAEAAAEFEPLYAERGHLVISNASRFRMEPGVPLVVPEVNPDAIESVASQPWSGGLVTNPNCMVIGLVMALAPLQRAFGIERVVVTSFQALSGAGYPGVPSLAAIGNVIPLISVGEEDKIQREPLKILGADFPISAVAHRVPVVDGHLASVRLDLAGSAPEIAEVARVMREFRGAPQDEGFPTAPECPLIVHDRPDRPQPALDVELGNGMSVSVGRLGPDPLFDLRFHVLVHNTVRGAAGAALLNAELAAARGLLANRGVASR